MNGYLDTKAHQELRAISSRADISATSFHVYYHYSNLKAEPYKVMLKHFDIGFYYANWGAISTYIKLPAGTIPDALLNFSSDGLHVYQSDEWQLLIFSIEEYYEYFDDENADNFFRHLVGLRSELMQGNWRLLYFMWLKESDETSTRPNICNPYFTEIVRGSKTTFNCCLLLSIWITILK